MQILPLSNGSSSETYIFKGSLSDLRVLLVNGPLSHIRDVLSQELERNPDVVVIANEDVLAILPITDSLIDNIECCLSLADNFQVFHAFERKWTWDHFAKEKIQEVLTELVEKDRHRMRLAGTVYVYLNGAFQQRFYPAIARSEDEYESIIPQNADAQRYFNLKSESLMRTFGEQSVQNLWLLPSPEGNAYTCYDRHRDIVGIGRGRHTHEMRRGAIYEYLERLAAADAPENMVVGTYRDLKNVAMHPAELWGCPEEQVGIFFPDFCPKREYEWVPAFDAVGERLTYIPLQMVNYLSTRESFFHAATNSSGCALGNSLEEAAFHGALEVLERDALLAMWYTRSRAPRIILDEPGRSRIGELAYLIESRGYQLDLFDLTTDFEIPVVLAVAYGRDPKQLAAFVTAACNPDPGKALHAAADELHSLLAICESNFQRKGQSFEEFKSQNGLNQRESQYFHYAFRENLEHFDFLKRPGPTMHESLFIATHKTASCSVRDSFQKLKQSLGRRGYRLIIANNSPKYLQSMGIESVKVFIPHTFKLIFGDEPIHSSRKRIHDIAASRPWFQDRDIPLFPQLHPLG